MLMRKWLEIRLALRVDREKCVVVTDPVEEILS
jgi:hypothetical protein